MHSAGLSAVKGGLCGARSVAYVWRTAVGRVGRHGDGVRDRCLCREMCDQGSVACDIELIAGLGGDHIAVFSPIGEGEVLIGCGGDSAGLAIMEGTTTSYCAAVDRVGRHRDGVAVL